MKNRFSDILALAEDANETILWWDENGTPRFAPFHPELSPNIYTHNCGLFEIECQSCQARLAVEMNTSWLDSRMKHPPRKWAYGDPPWHGCPGAGETMTSDMVRVLAFWTRSGGDEWERRPELEGEAE